METSLIEAIVTNIKKWSTMLGYINIAVILSLTVIDEL